MEKAQNAEQAIIPFLKTFRLIHLGLVSAMVLFGALALWLRHDPVYQFPVGADVFVYGIPVIALIGYFAGWYIFKKMLAPLEADHPTSRKLTRFQSASLLHYSCLETPALLALYAYILQAYVLYLAIAAFLILYLFSLRPTRRKILEHVPFNPNEIRA